MCPETLWGLVPAHLPDFIFIQTLSYILNSSYSQQGVSVSQTRIRFLCTRFSLLPVPQDNW